MSNVVQRRKRAAAKSQAKPRKKPKPANDAALIRACVAFAQNYAAAFAGFELDPTDNEYAGPMHNALSAKYEANLAKVAQLSAATPEELDGKARLAMLLATHEESHLVPEELRASLLSSIAHDVREVLKPIIHERWLAENAAEQEAAAQAK